MVQKGIWIKQLQLDRLKELGEYFIILDKLNWLSAFVGSNSIPLPSNKIVEEIKAQKENLPVMLASVKQGQNKNWEVVNRVVVVKNSWPN